MLNVYDNYLSFWSYGPCRYFFQEHRTTCETKGNCAVPSRNLGITIHQPISSEHLGPSNPEYALKERKPKRAPPSDYRAKSYLGIYDQSRPFSLFLWYVQQKPTDPLHVVVGRPRLTQIL